ncbi:DUF185-domain-containing protein [Auriculariales sp. MPI-PUGE-AT-0066]|nr:DUF185-domain-containing protein [Auriculariales sp. MPI-PUGE-AT-0066]
MLARVRWRAATRVPLSFAQALHTSARVLRTKHISDELFTDSADEKLVAYPLVTATDLARSDRPPTEVRLLARDYIDNALYNPHYGYFAKRAVIFTTGDDAAKGFDFGNIRNQLKFDGIVADRYQEFGVDPDSGPGRQIWHTPTELFRPWYGQAIAQCLVSEYLLKYFPYEDLIIYEVGAGNGTLGTNILDFIRERYPDVYERTRYRIIEISKSLAENQKRSLHHHSCVEVINKSIFEWRQREWAPCFFLALEVVDNFPHDIVRYHAQSGEPFQTMIAIDDGGEYHEVFEPVRDPLLSSYLSLRSTLRPGTPYSTPWWKLRHKLPFAPNLSKPHFVPTRMYDLLMRLRTHFPRHRLLLSDFSSLPEAIDGHDAPVVQTRFRNLMVPVTTYLVTPGYFDIFFPTDFELLRDVYEAVMVRKHHVTDQGRSSPLGSIATSVDGAQYFFFRGRREPMDGVVSASGLPIGLRHSGVYSHREFLETYADLDQTKLMNGDNPMLDLYQNVKFLF